MRIIPDSELIINDDGSAFHLHIKPEQLSDKIIVMGDPDRVSMIKPLFDTIECDIQKREFHTITGSRNGKRITALSHGIGGDNIDIVMTELDALANVDFQTRQVKSEFRQLSIVRVGTSGGMQKNCPIGSFVASEKSIGMDEVLFFYKNSKSVRDLDFEVEFQQQTNWPIELSTPYVVSADQDLLDRIAFDMIKGVTISAIGFYGPQGRNVRLPLAYPDLNSKIQLFKYNKYQISNYEMESSTLAGLAKMMGHKALTICSIIANRVALESDANYKNSIEDLLEIVFDRI